MAETKTESDDLVLSYVVNANGALTNLDTVKEALSNGYRIIDVIPVPMNSVSVVCVTVVLSKEKSSFPVPYKWFLHRK